MVVSRVTDQVGRVLGGRYRLVALIGVGASAQVYLADDVTLRRRVAVKLLHDALAEDEAFLKRFRTEAQSSAQLAHPHIMAVFDWGDDRVPYIVMEYLGGGSLRGMLDRERTLSLSQTLLVGLETARALEHAHRRGFVHRDLKPANLLFGEDGRLRVADFGLARALAEAAWTEPQGAVLGTARYASPEQAQGRPVDGKGDIYSLALIMVEAATGTVPFAADTTIGTLMARVGQSLDPPAALGPLRTVLERAGRIDPEERPDAREMTVALMARAHELDPPQPLPLAGAIDSEAMAPADPAPTEHIATVVVDPPPDVNAAADDAPLSRRARRKADVAAGVRTRRRWPWALAALIAVIGGAGAAYAAYEANKTPTHEVPSLRNATVDEAQAVADENGWVLDDTAQLRNEEVREDEIIDQDPAAGTDLAEGETLTVTVSLGPPRWELPAGLVGLPIGQARSALADAEADGAVIAEPTTRFDEEVDQDIVLEVRVDNDVVDPAAAGLEFEAGSDVELVVSDGPEPRTVPDDLVGLTLAEALAVIEPMGLTGGETQEFNDEVEAGRIISHNPPAGDQVPRGSNIDFVVSRGPRLVEVPDVSGEDIITACEQLAAQELICEGVSGNPNREVVTTDPGPGDMVRPGTGVVVVTRGGGGGD